VKLLILYNILIKVLKKIKGKIVHIVNPQRRYTASMWQRYRVKRVLIGGKFRKFKWHHQPNYRYTLPVIRWYQIDIKLLKQRSLLVQVLYYCLEVFETAFIYYFRRLYKISYYVWRTKIITRLQKIKHKLFVYNLLQDKKCIEILTYLFKKGNRYYVVDIIVIYPNNKKIRILLHIRNILIYIGPFLCAWVGFRIWVWLKWLITGLTTPLYKFNTKAVRIGQTLSTNELPIEAYYLRDQLVKTVNFCWERAKQKRIIRLKIKRAKRLLRKQKLGQIAFHIAVQFSHIKRDNNERYQSLRNFYKSKIPNSHLLKKRKKKNKNKRKKKRSKKIKYFFRSLTILDGLYETYKNNWVQAYYDLVEFIQKILNLPITLYNSLLELHKSLISTYIKLHQLLGRFDQACLFYYEQFEPFLKLVIQQIFDGMV
jgi:hypothetical protein